METAITPVVTESIEEITEKFLKWKKKGAEALIGMSLEAAKVRAKYDQENDGKGWNLYYSWVVNTVQMSDWYAKMFLQVADFVARYDPKALPQQSVIFKLAARATPEAAVRQILERTASGEKLSVEQAEEIIDTATGARQSEENYIIAHAPEQMYNLWADGILSHKEVYQVVTGYASCEHELTRAVIERHGIGDARIIPWLTKMEDRAEDEREKAKKDKNAAQPDDQLQVIFDTGYLQTVDGSDAIPILEVTERDIKAIYAFNRKENSMSQSDAPAVYLDETASIFQYDTRFNKNNSEIYVIELGVPKVIWEAAQRNGDLKEGSLVRLKLQEPKG